MPPVMSANVRLKSDCFVLQAHNRKEALKQVLLHFYVLYILLYRILYICLELMFSDFKGFILKIPSHAHCYDDNIPSKLNLAPVVSLNTLPATGIEQTEQRWGDMSYDSL